MLTVDELRTLLSGLTREERIKEALSMLRLNQSEAADLIGRNATNVRKALNGSENEAILEALEAEVRKRLP